MNTAVSTFKNNIASVEKLINFDLEVIGMAIESIEELHTSLVNKLNITNEHLNGKRTLDILNTIHSNDSLKTRFSIINNQAVVLLVSYFGSAIADLFRDASKNAIETKHDKRVLGSELKLNIYELTQLNTPLGDSIGDLLITKNSISFQDMKSIQREFKKYFGITIDKDETINNIIVSQACRHSIVHEGGKVNSRIINQVKFATPRELKAELSLGSNIEFSEEEIKVVSNNMLAYVSNLANKVDAYKNI